MASIIKFSLKKLNALVNDSNSCVTKQTVTRNVSFQPWCLSNLKDSLGKIMDYKIGKYDKQLNGIILSYKNVKILDDIYAIRQDSSELFSDVQADFFVFQPHVGATLHGIINKKSVTHLGVLMHRVFNVVIPRPTEKPGNKWIGSQLSVGQQVFFKIIVLDLFGALPYIRGCLDESCLPQLLDEGDTTVQPVDGEGLSVSYVNFDRIKPASSKNVEKNQQIDHFESNVLESDTKTIDNLKTDDSENSSESDRKKSKKKIKSSNVRTEISTEDVTRSPEKQIEKKPCKGEKYIKEEKMKKGKKYLCDSDVISDVDDDVLNEQKSWINKIRKFDKDHCNINSEVFVKIKKFKNTELDKDIITHKVKKLKMPIPVANSTFSKTIDISKITNDLSTSKVKLDKRDITDLSCFDLKKNKKLGIFSTSTPLGHNTINLKKNAPPSIQSINNISNITDYKKKLSFSNNSSSDLKINNSKERRLPSKEDLSGKIDSDVRLNSSKKVTKNSVNLSSECSRDITVSSIQDSHVEKDISSQSLKHKKKIRKDNRTNSLYSSDSEKQTEMKLIEINATESSIEIKNKSFKKDNKELYKVQVETVDDYKLNPVDEVLKLKKRKRKHSASSSSITEAVQKINGDDAASYESPRRKKLKKSDSTIEFNNVNLEDASSSHLESHKSKRKKKKSSKGEEGREIEETQESHPEANDLKSDKTSLICTPEANSKINAQHIIDQIKNNPSLLLELQQLMQFNFSPTAVKTEAEKVPSKKIKKKNIH